MKDDYSAIFRNLKTTRRSDYHVYDPHYKSRAWKLTMAALTVAVVVSVLLIAAFA